MCGSYIHGRSWLKGNSWEHFCEPYKVNAHCEMPRPGVEERIQIPNDALAHIICALEGKKPSTYPFIEVCSLDGIPDFIAVNALGNPAYSDLKYNKLTIDLRNVTDVQRTFSDRESRGDKSFVIIKKFPTVVINWGIQPWDGKPKIQHNVSKTSWFETTRDCTWDEKLLKKLRSKKFLPLTQSNLIQWAKIHWGKREDKHEFRDLMPRCLDYKKLAPQLPNWIRKLTHQRTSRPNYPNGEIIWDDYDAPDSAKLARALGEASDPCDRFCEMFAVAPNAFWAERN